MPYEIKWLLENRIVYMRDYDECVLEDLRDAVEDLYKLLGDGEKPVHLIHDNRDVTKYPISMETLKSVVKKHANMGWIVFVSQDKLARFITVVLSTAVGQSAKHAETLDEAMAILRKVDLTLPDEFSRS